MDAYAAAKKYDIPIIGDGGIKFSGDPDQSLAAGASVCMMGSILQAVREAPGTFELYQGRKYKVYRGMGFNCGYGERQQDRYFQTNAKSFCTRRR